MWKGLQSPSNLFCSLKAGHMSHVMDTAILCHPAAEILQPLLATCFWALLSLPLEQFPEIWPESPLLQFKAITFVLATSDKKNKSFSPSLQ